MDQKALDKNLLRHEGMKRWLSFLAERLGAIDAFTVEETEKVIRETAEELEIKAGTLINGIRTAVTGQAVGPGLFDVLTALGQERVVERLRRALKLIE
jgi:glutamyl-tRNA synthetase